MALNASGNISLAGSVDGESVALELGRAPFDEITLNDTDVRTLLAVPAGTIGMQVAYAKSRVLSRNITLTNNQLEFVLAPNIISGYTAGTTAVTLTINSGVYVYSDNTGRAGLTVTGFAAGDTVSIVNNGYIIGKGGDGGYVGATNAQSDSFGIGTYDPTKLGLPGGPALKINNDVTITNNSYIAGGGGGGAAGFWNRNSSGIPTGGTGGGGAGGGRGGGCRGSRDGTFSNFTLTQPYIAGGAPGQNGQDGQSNSNFPNRGSGGGRILPGTGGAGGYYVGTSRFNSIASGGGGGGGYGGTSENGGNGGSANSVGANGAGASPNGAGGGGGGWGGAGGDSAAAIGGAGGASIQSNNNAIYFVSTGTLYGAISGNAFIGNVSLSTNTTNYTFNPAKVTGYVAGQTKATLIVNSGVYLYSTATATPALTVSGWAAGDQVTIINNGFIMGMGGSALLGPTAGTVGGSAISLGVNCVIINNSFIGGGGGSGTSGRGGGGGGAGGGNGGLGDDGAGGTAAGVGGGPGLSGTAGGATGDKSFYGHGGGGGRIMPGTGGAGGARGFQNFSTMGGRGGGAGGGGGGTENGGGGGAGGSAGSAGGIGEPDPGVVGGLASAGGGGGGGYGASGGSSRTFLGTLAGGAGGKAIALNGFTATLTVPGTTYGAVS
jgi:hypothetical protein